MPPPDTWQIALDRILSLDQPRLIGVLNVTPDSFSDGGTFLETKEAVEHGLGLVGRGASVIDIGGQSTRPGSQPVDDRQQIDRIVPVIRRLRRRTHVPISVDTTLAVVAEAGLAAGADIINDVSAGTEDDGIFELAADRRCGLVLMHRRVPPESDSYSDQYAKPPHYDDVVDEVRHFLMERCAAAVDRGVEASSIVIDPGLGFGKSVEQNYELIRRTDELVETGYPVLSAASRKSFVGAVTGHEVPRDRVAGSTAISVIHWLYGVRLFRVHDVAAHRDALTVAAAVGSAAAPASI